MSKNKLFLTAKDIQCLQQCSYSTALRVIQRIRIVQDKVPPQRITLSDYAVYTGVSVEEVRTFFNGRSH
jgi:hypothetical protein